MMQRGLMQKCTIRGTVSCAETGQPLASQRGVEGGVGGGENLMSVLIKALLAAP